MLRIFNINANINGSMYWYMSGLHCHTEISK